MPIISLNTNVQLDSEDARRAFISDFSKFCAKTVGKEEKYFNIDVSFNPYFMHGGTFEPATKLHIMSIGNINPTNSQIWSKEFSAYFEQKLGVPPNRGYMIFTDPGVDTTGWNGMTIAALQAASAR